MHDPQIERMAAKIRSSGRRRRPGGRWSNPASPLQAARFAARKSGKEVVAAIRALCPGHGGEPCRIDVSKVSDYETGNRRPSLEHIEAFCRLYERSPEALGLINWRNGSTPEPEAPAATNAAERQGDRNAEQEQLVVAWMRDSAMTVATAVIEALAKCPVPIIADPDGHQPASEDGPHDEDPPAEATASG